MHMRDLDERGLSQVRVEITHAGNCMGYKTVIPLARLNWLSSERKNGRDVLAMLILFHFYCTLSQPHVIYTITHKQQLCWNPNLNFSFQVIKQPDVRLDMKKNKSKAHIYIRSSNVDERMLSTLIILKTISRGKYNAFLHTKTYLA